MSKGGILCEELLCLNSMGRQELTGCGALQLCTKVKYSVRNTIV